MKHFTEGIEAAQGSPSTAPRELLAALHSNRALANAKLGLHTAAAEDSLKAIKLRPQWAKPYYRLALARLQMGRFREVWQSQRGSTSLWDRTLF